MGRGVETIPTLKYSRSRLIVTKICGFGHKKNSDNSEQFPKHVLLVELWAHFVLVFEVWKLFQELSDNWQMNWGIRMRMEAVGAKVCSFFKTEIYLGLSLPISSNFFDKHVV